MTIWRSLRRGLYRYDRIRRRIVFGIIDLYLIAGLVAAVVALASLLFG